MEGLASRGLEWEELAVEGEPSPALVDDAVARFRPWRPDAVLATLGGQTALNAATNRADLERRLLIETGGRTA